MKILDLIKKNIFFVIAILIIIICVTINIIRDYRAGKVKYENKAMIDDYVTVPKTYGVNEYMNFNISNDTIIRMYFDDFKALFVSNINEAYLKLNEEYRNKKFPNIDSFRNYLNSINFVNSKIDKYSMTSTKYVMYDKNGKMYIFKIDGVLQYSVYFDEDTVEIR